MAICVHLPIPFVLPEPPPNSSAAVRRSIRYAVAKSRRERAAFVASVRELEVAGKRTRSRNAA